MSERARALDQAREWQAIAYGDYPETWAALDYYRERGWPVDANTFPERHTVEDKVFAFKAGYRAAVDPPPSGASPQATGGYIHHSLTDWIPTPGCDCDRCTSARKSAPKPTGGASPQAETSEDMGDGWYVTVGRWGESLVTIEQRCLSGNADLTDDDAALIRGAAKHLQAFIGQPAPVSPVEPTPEPPTDQLRETPMGHRIFRHVCGTPEDDGECMACSQIDCPDGEPLHYHHDGCPCCSQKPTGAPAPCVWREVNPPMGPVRRMRPGCRKTAQTFTLPLVEAWKVCPYCGAPLKVEREP